MMRLSEAIRLGALTGPQAYGSSLMYLPSGIARCAMAGAAYAIGKGNFRQDTTILEFDIPNALLAATAISTCPDCGRVFHSSAWLANQNVRRLDKRPGVPAFFFTVMHLNDYHKLSRERIADWVELEEVLDSLEGGTELEKGMSELEQANVV